MNKGLHYLKPQEFEIIVISTKDSKEIKGAVIQDNNVYRDYRDFEDGIEMKKDEYCVGLALKLNGK